MSNPVAYPEHNPAPQDNQQDGTARVWLSQRQWMSVLEGTERMARESAESAKNNVPETGTRRAEIRQHAPQDARCLIRMGNNTDEHGTYLVKIRDVSATGLGFNSAHRFAPSTRCTVALQDPDGHGLVCAARIVWSKPIDDQLHDVGVQFDQPIDTTRFTSDSPDIPC